MLWKALGCSGTFHFPPGLINLTIPVPKINMLILARMLWSTFSFRKLASQKLLDHLKIILVYKENRRLETALHGRNCRRLILALKKIVFLSMLSKRKLLSGNIRAIGWIWKLKSIPEESIGQCAKKTLCPWNNQALSEGAITGSPQFMTVMVPVHYGYKWW